MSEHSSSSGPNRLGLQWLDIAIQLEDENSELRRMLTALIFWLAERDELFTFVREEIDRRWPDAARRAA